MANTLELQIASCADDLPTQAQFQHWLDTVLADSERDNEVVIRIVDEAESAQLNRQYRQKSGATNVLSFPFEAPEHIDMGLLGDLVICAPVVAKEAAEQQKTCLDHWAHITVHGLLHLLGYDHIDDTEALAMEALEIQILAQLNINNPYLEEGIV